MTPIQNNKSILATTVNMSPKELFCITSKSYTDLMTSSLRDLYESKRFSDVTLVTEDQKFVKAHKFILSANSDLFKTILENKDIESSTVFLRGIKYSTLLPIVEFCYIGRADVDQDCVTEFIETAKDLKVSEFLKAEQRPTKDPLQHTQTDTTTANDNVDGNIEESDIKPSFITSLNAGGCFDKAIKNENGIINGPVKCEHCDVVCSHIGNLRRHVKNKHDGIKFSCSECDYKATQKLDIKRHKEYKHEGKRFNCEECNHKSTTKGSLKIHIDAIHRGIKYPCHSCEYKATTPGSLNIHIGTKHCVKIANPFVDTASLF